MQTRLQGQQWNPWKVIAIGMLVVFAVALITGVVVARYTGTQEPNPPVAQEPAPKAPVAQEPAPKAPRLAAAPVEHSSPRPTAADIDACNRYASSAGGDRTKQTLTNALLGGAVGAGLGAAGGAIAGGGSGAGKGAGIGGLVGAAAGTLYGLNQANQDDARAAQAYRVCMKRRGYVD